MRFKEGAWGRGLGEGRQGAGPRGSPCDWPAVLRGSRSQPLGGCDLNAGEWCDWNTSASDIAEQGWLSQEDEMGSARETCCGFTSEWDEAEAGTLQPAASSSRGDSCQGLAVVPCAQGMS